MEISYGAVDKQSLEQHINFMFRQQLLLLQGPICLVLVGLIASHEAGRLKSSAGQQIKIL